MSVPSDKLPLRNVMSLPSSAGSQRSQLSQQGYTGRYRDRQPSVMYGEGKSPASCTEKVRAQRHVRRRREPSVAYGEGKSPASCTEKVRAQCHVRRRKQPSVMYGEGKSTASCREGIGDRTAARHREGKKSHGVDGKYEVPDDVDGENNGPCGQGRSLAR